MLAASDIAILKTSTTHNSPVFPILTQDPKAVAPPRRGEGIPPPPRQRLKGRQVAERLGAGGTLLYKRQVTLEDQPC